MPPDDGRRRGFEYPTEYPIMLIGLSADDFVEHARRLVERAVGAAPAGPVAVRASERGKYQSVTLVVTLRSDAQRAALYAALREDPRVVYAL